MSGRTPPPDGIDVAVVGAGVIGLAAAWRAAATGLRVVVVDPEPGRGASWAAAGMLAPVTEVHYGEEPLLALTLAAAERWSGFADALADAAGMDPGYRRCGTLMVALDADENAALARLHAFQTAQALRAERLSGRDVRRLEPALSPRTRGGVLVDGDHQVDNRALVTALVRACERAGVAFVRASVASASIENGRARGVVLRDGTAVAADWVVLAAGCRTGEIGGVPPEAAIRVRPVKGQLLHLRGPAPLARRTIRGMDAYLVFREDGRVVVGATVEERAFDTSVTAGAVHELLRAARELIPAIDDLEVVELTAGLRPGTPDNAPLIGATSVAHLAVATGHYRNGVLLAPVTADGVVELVTTGSLPDLVAPFAPDRLAFGALR